MKIFISDSVIVQDQFLEFLMIGILPLVMLFLLERYFMYRLKKSEWKERYSKNFWLHPNFISYMRYPMGLVSVTLYAFVSKPFAIFWFGVWMISDITDGSIARHLNLITKRGESIDPLSDKLLYFPPLFYAAYLGMVDLKLVLIYLLLDTIGQGSRLFVKSTAANLFGKAKTFLTVISLMIPFIQDTYFTEVYFHFADICLILTCILSFCSFFFRVIPNYWYANILSILNFLCGIIGIIVLIIGGSEFSKYALGLVFLGQFLDLFDGRAAERWGSPPSGEFLDDLADGTNFGGTIAVMIFYSIQNFALGLFLAMVHFICTVYRLVRFINDKKISGVARGVNVFSGLPSPGGAMFIGTAIIILDRFNYSFLPEPWILKTGVVLFGAFLMVSRIPYIHVGRSLLPKIPKFFQVLIYTMTLVTLVIAFRDKSDYHVILLSFLLTVVYLFFGIQFRKKKPAKEKS